MTFIHSALDASLIVAIYSFRIEGLSLMLATHYMTAVLIFIYKVLMFLLPSIGP